MKKFSICIIITFISALFISCISIQNSSFSEVDTNAGREIVAEASASGFLHLTAPDTFSLERIALENLKSQCNGKIVNTTTRLEMRELIIIQSYTIKLTGMCAK